MQYIILPESLGIRQNVLDEKNREAYRHLNLLHTVITAYEIQDIADLVRRTDSKAIINVIPTENFYGGFY